jgi:GNAT superfamily N-acetyltransferase
MDVCEYGADDLATVSDTVDLLNAVTKLDSPWMHPETVTRLRGWLRYGWDGEVPRCFSVRDGSRLVAVGQLHTSEWDNRDLAWTELFVHPDARRRGVGSLLLGHLLDEARAMGRTSAGVDGWDAPGPAAFADRHGFVGKYRAIHRRQHLAEVDATTVAELYDEASAAASSYELLRIAGRTPDDLLGAVAELTAAINDAPTDDLDIEDEVFPAERVRAYEASTLARGNRMYHLVARHRESGALAGHTIVSVEEERPQLGDQHDTSVVREHRGHRLGLLLKAGMLQWLAEAEPQLQSIDTGNAESNEHMIAVNERLGYRVLGRDVAYQRAI